MRVVIFYYNHCADIIIYSILWYVYRNCRRCLYALTALGNDIMIPLRLRRRDVIIVHAYLLRAQSKYANVALVVRRNWNIVGNNFISYNIICRIWISTPPERNHKVTRSACVIYNIRIYIIIKWKYKNAYRRAEHLLCSVNRIR